MYSTYYCLGFVTNKHNKEGTYIYKEAFNNITHLIRIWIHVNCLYGGFIIYNDNVLIHKQEVVPTIPDYISHWIVVNRKKY